MLINYVPGEECRIAIVRDGHLEEFYQERASAESHVGNIYQGKVLNVEPAIQAAFVDFGLERNGFLHVSDLHPKYFPGKDREEFEQVGSKTPHRDRPPIQKCLRRGDKVLVQVLKEGIGTKGPTLTSYLSIPGRFLVMMPDMQRTGVSRKVEDDEARRQMKQILQELKPPEEFGFIVRTAGLGQTKTELKRDLAYLQRLWKNLERRRKELKGPGELYTESDLVIRTIRDVFTTDIERIVVDDPSAARRAHDFLAVASPRSRSKVVYYDGRVPLFHHFEIEPQIESIHSREVPLPSGGSLVIDQTEALVAIDVNSGKSREARDAETNAYKTNIEATDEICRQLRLRDLGGVVVNDLIDMRDAKHRRAIETRFRNNLKRDRARTRLGSISSFGLMEMTRQRMRPSLENSIYTHCDACAGTGHVKSPESVVLDVMRRLALAMHHSDVARIELTISPDVAFQLLNRKRQHLVDLEKRFGKQVMVRVGGTTIDHVHISAFDSRGGAVEPETLSSRQMPDESQHAFIELTGQPLDLELEAEAEEAELAQAASATAAEPDPDAETRADADAKPSAVSGDEAATDDDGQPRRRRRRRRGGRRRRKSGDDAAGDATPGDRSHTVDAESADEAGEPSAKAAVGESKSDAEGDGDAKSEADGADPSASNGEAAPKRRRRRRGGRRRGKGRSANAESNAEANAEEGHNDGDGEKSAANGAEGDAKSASQSASKSNAPNGAAADSPAPQASKSQTDSQSTSQGGAQGNARIEAPTDVKAGPPPTLPLPDDRPAVPAEPTVGSGYSNRIVGVDDGNGQ